MSIVSAEQANGALQAAKMLAGMVGLGPHVEAATAVFTAGKDLYGFTLDQWASLAPHISPEQAAAIANQYEQNMQQARARDLRNEPGPTS